MIVESDRTLAGGIAFGGSVGLAVVNLTDEPIMVDLTLRDACGMTPSQG